MKQVVEMYTGKLTYQEIEFTFAFDGEDLHLIPPDEKKHEFIMGNIVRHLGNGVYVNDDPLIMKEPFLIGECNEINNVIIFLPKQGSVLGSRNSVLIVTLYAYIVCTTNNHSIDRMNFQCPEINYIHPTNLAYVYPDPRGFENGEVTFSTRSFEETTTIKQHFQFAGTDVSASFGIDRNFNTHINEPPFSANSSLMFEFEATEDYQFIIQLWRIARGFVQYLCYRNNIYIPEVKLFSPYEGGLHERCGTMYLLRQNEESEEYAIKKEMCIKQQHIAGHEGEILSDIATRKLYVRHMPESYRSGRHIDAARFVMIIAAFEWEFRRLYLNGFIKLEESVEDALNKEPDEQKKTVLLTKTLKKIPLKDRIMQMFEGLSSIIDPFAEQLYRLNKEECIYEDVAERLKEQRHRFAHGDLEQDFEDLSLLDLILMERTLYVMQLKFYGIDDKEIQKSINELFHLSFRIV